MRKLLAKKIKNGLTNIQVKKISKLLPKKQVFNGLLGSNEEDMQNQNGILTFTCFNGLLGFDNQNMHIQKGIVTMISLNGLLCSDC